MKIPLFCLLFLLAAPVVMAESIYMDDSLPPGPNFRVAAFRLWYNNNVSTIRGVLVLVTGSNGDGRNMSEDTGWQHLADKYGFALLGCYFTDKPHKNMAIEHYVNVSLGSGQALLTTLSGFADKSGHPELARAPLLFWGVSAGGEFNYEFACWKPERTIAFVVNKGGVYYTNLASPETRAVPGLFFTGSDDMVSRTEVVRGIFSGNRRFGALWTYIEEPGISHEFARSKIMTEIFFDEIIPARMPDQNGSVALKPPSEKDGLKGDLRTFEIKDYNTTTGDDYPTSWLLNNRVADAWQKSIKGLSFR